MKTITSKTKLVEKKCVKCNSFFEEESKTNDKFYEEQELDFENDTAYFVKVLRNKCKTCDYNEKLYLWQSGRGNYPE